jgi:hypothetical protein
MRPKDQLALGLAIALTGLAGCGGSDKQTTPAPGAADPRVVARIPLKATVLQVVARIGAPARIERSRIRPGKSKRSRRKACYIYRVRGGRPTDHIDMCFVDGKLGSVLVIAAKNRAQ